MSDKENSWYEGLAKKILEEYCADRYVNLEKRESPDFQDKINGIGIEITRAGHEEDFKLSSIFSRVAGRTEKELTKKEKKELERNKISVVDMDDYESQLHENDAQNLTFTACEKHGICIGDAPVRWASNEIVIDAIRRKIESINKSDYGIFETYDLFVYADNFKFFEEWVEISQYSRAEETFKRRCIAFEIMNDVNVLHKGKERKFSTIYVLDYANLYELDLSGRKYRHRTINIKL